MKIKQFIIIPVAVLGLFLSAGIFNAHETSQGHTVNVPFVNQDKLVSGCEAVSASMLLKFWGYNISEEDFYDNYLIKRDWRYGKDGKMYAPDPNCAYAGNARIRSGINCGFGCYANTLRKSIEKAIDKSKHKVLNITGSTISELCSLYIDKGIPVIIWATSGMVQSKRTCAWRVSYVCDCSRYRLGDSYTWIANEHCLVLTGYDADYCVLNDPQKGKDIKVEMRLLERRFGELDMQAIAIVPIDD